MNIEILILFKSNKGMKYFFNIIFINNQQHWN